MVGQVTQRPLGREGRAVAPQIFLSYSSADAAVAERALAHLERSGLACWIASRDVVPGDDFAAQVMRAIELCPVTVVFITPSANSSAHVRREVERAVSLGRRVQPVSVDGTVASEVLAYFFTGSQWLHLDRSPSPAGLDALVKLVRDGPQPGLDTRTPPPFHEILARGIPTISPQVHHRLATVALVCSATLVLAPVGLVLGLTYLVTRGKNEEGRIAAWSAVIVALGVLIVAGAALAGYLYFRDLET
jgi:hypothetical protein